MCLKYNFLINTSALLISRLTSGILWRGNTPTKSSVDAKIIREVERLWSEGRLPYKFDEKNTYVVGYTAYMSFYNCSVYPITVGPAKPSKFKPKWAKINMSERF